MLEIYKTALDFVLLRETVWPKAVGCYHVYSKLNVIAFAVEHRLSQTSHGIFADPLVFHSF
jgi:hypothetical protein